ncbi:MAG: MFS transporter [Gammaproteobacteria bacterium]|nr:MFS transporter [Gammaproteobacteria bacterium]
MLREMTTWEMYRSLLFSVYLPSFFMSICQGSVLLVIPLFALDLGANAGVAALVFSLRGLGNMVMDVPAGYAAARLGDKYTMLVGVCLMVVTGGLASQATSPTELAAAAFLFGGSMATWLIARLTHISEAIPAYQRGKAISTMAGLQRLGNLIGPVTSGIVAVQFGFEFVFLGVSIIAAAAFFMVIFFIPRNKKGHHDDSPNIVKLVPHILGTHLRVFATAGVAVLFLTVLRSGRQLLIPLWGESLSLDASDIGLIMGTAAAIDMTMFPAAGYIMDNWGRRYAAIACLTLLSFGIFLVPYTTNFSTLVLVAMVVGLGNGLGSGINMTLGADFAPPHERGEFLGVWRLMGDSGSFAGPLFMGYIANTFLLATALSVTASLGLIGILMMAVFVKETLVKRS